MARILTSREVAAKLSVKPLTAVKMLREGRIPGRKLGKAWRVNEAELEEFLRSSIAAEEVAGRVSARGFLQGVPGFSTEDLAQAKREERELESEREHSR